MIGSKVLHSVLQAVITFLMFFLLLDSSDILDISLFFDEDKILELFLISFTFFLLLDALLYFDEDETMDEAKITDEDMNKYKILKFIKKQGLFDPRSGEHYD